MKLYSSPEVSEDFLALKRVFLSYDFLGTVKAAPHECVIRTGQP